MGIVNATPDSFSDGGVHDSAAAAAAHGATCIAQGAAMIDVGGESTRPGAERVPADVQIARTVPVIEQLREAGATVSIDTTLASVARAALAAGAHAVNDVSAGAEDPAMFDTVARAGCGLVLMHRLVAPAEDRYSDRYDTPPQYADVAAEVRDWLAARAALAERAGVARACIALDPGLGFGKSVAQNFELVARLPTLAALKYPIVVGASRKSFIAAVTGGQPPHERVAGSVGVAIAAALGGATILRVHDVAAHRQALLAWAACR